MHQQYVADVKTQAANAISTFNIEQIYSEVDPTNPWAILNAYLSGAADQVAQAVTPNWIDRLGGADVCTWANAYAAVESLRIDYSDLGPFAIRS